MTLRDVYELIARYLVLLVLGAFKLALLYSVFRPLTVYPVFWIVSSFGDATLLEQNLIFIYGLSEFIEIIPACIAGAAYYLLLILNLTTPMKIEKRIKSIFFLLAAFLLLNIIRIVVFVGILFYGYQYFDITHTLVWYFGSTVLVVFIWFLNVWLFKIKNIPVYSDVKGIFNDIKR